MISLCGKQLIVNFITWPYYANMTSACIFSNVLGWMDEFKIVSIMCRNLGSLFELSPLLSTSRQPVCLLNDVHSLKHDYN